ncbi:hypothetical protein JTE90_001662 [Oedothorax gibbosus]|uniref:EamA domain-containing protein n=1 Tax=Oedothorax gibbosus TaxID=931172 RepID=A0AAV6UVR9_9ARAC|nr:hypothetical protein JTE90_001662 [Oedothorax gibbosus]
MAVNSRELILALLCAFLGSVKGLLVSLVRSLGAIQIFGLRSIGAICFILPIVIFKNYQLRYDLKTNLILLVRSVVGNIAVCGYYFGFVYLPIAEASLLFYSTPVFTVIIGCLFLNEKCGVLEIISVLLSFAGVALVCVPDFATKSGSISMGTIKGVVGSLVGAIAQALALAIIRKITFIPPPVVSFWWAVVGVIVSAVLTGAQGNLETWECGWEALFVLLIAVVGFISELCLIGALKSTNAVVVSIALTSEILWAFLLQIFVSRKIPQLMCMFGGLAIVVSILVQPAAKCASMCLSRNEKVAKEVDVEDVKNEL